MSIVIKGRSRHGGGGWKRPSYYDDTDHGIPDPPEPPEPTTRIMSPPTKNRWWSNKQWRQVIATWDRVRADFKSHLPPGVQFPNQLTDDTPDPGVRQGGERISAPPSSFPSSPLSLTERSEGSALFLFEM